MICKLCLKDRPLIKKSHIIPDFMYKGLYDGTHKLRVFSPYERAKGEGYVKKPSSGEYEGGLLCEVCDNELLGGYYENYASKAIYGGQLPVIERPICENYVSQDGFRFSKYRNITYEKFKIFLLSILWRASISSRPFFKNISLGSHSETLRRMIYEGKPGDIDDYPIGFLTYKNDNSLATDLIAQPKQVRLKSGHRASLFMISGFIYIFYINSKSHRLPEEVLNSTIRPENEMEVIHIPIGKGRNFILSYLGFEKNL